MTVPRLPGRFAGVVAACAVLLVLAAGGCSRKPPHEAVPGGATVLALGDSLTFGTGAGKGDSYPEVLADLTGWKVVNAGVPGDTAAQGCDRAPAALRENRPALMLVLLGGNDFLRRLPESGIRKGLEVCIAAAREAGIPMVLMPVPRLGVGRLAEAPLYRELAKANDLPLLDSGFGDLVAQPAMRADYVHLNAEGYRAMAERVAAGLRKLGFRD